MIRQFHKVTIIACAALLGLVFGVYAQTAPLVNWQSQNEYLAAVKANPKDFTAHNKLGNWYLHAGQMKAAIKEYKKAIKLNSHYAPAWNNLGSVYHAEKNFKKAVKCYRKAIELKPDLATVHKNLGSALLAMSRYDEGIAAFRKAMELDPSILDAKADVTLDAPGANVLTQYYYFAKLCAAAGRVNSAIEFLNKAKAAGFVDFKKVRLDPDFKDVVADVRFEAMTYGIEK
jgi:tetratricopeptide (TPR) repeat protein